jgi:hypothetical protein
MGTLTVKQKLMKLFVLVKDATWPAAGTFCPLLAKPLAMTLGSRADRGTVIRNRSIEETGIRYPLREVWGSVVLPPLPVFLLLLPLFPVLLALLPVLVLLLPPEETQYSILLRNKMTTYH